MDLGFIETQKFKKKLYLSGFFCTKVTESAVYQKYEEQRSKKCKARDVLNNENALKLIGEHNQEEDLSKLQARRIVNNIEKQTVTDKDAPKEIISKAAVSVSDVAAAHLPSVSSFNTSIFFLAKKPKQDILYL